jgi:hypothetical protein
MKDFVTESVRNWCAYGVNLDCRMLNEPCRLR